MTCSLAVHDVTIGVDCASACHEHIFRSGARMPQQVLQRWMQAHWWWDTLFVHERLLQQGKREGKHRCCRCGCDCSTVLCAVILWAIWWGCSVIWGCNSNKQKKAVFWLYVRPWSRAFTILRIWTCYEQHTGAYPHPQLSFSCFL